MSVVTSSRVWLSSGACEALKWVALLSMVVDHANKALFDSHLGWAVPIGRIAMPIFALLVAYNAARPGADLGKSLRRMLIAGLLAQPFHAVLFDGHHLPLNILFTFAASIAAMMLIERKLEPIALALVLVAGLFVDYAWVGIAGVLAVWSWRRTGRDCWLQVIGVTFVCYCVWIGNAWPLLALPLIVAAGFYAPYVPRLRWFFWAFYPTHLAALAWLAYAAGI